MYHMSINPTSIYLGGDTMKSWAEKAYEGIFDKDVEECTDRCPSEDDWNEFQDMMAESPLHVSRIEWEDLNKKVEFEANGHTVTVRSK